MTTPIQPVPDVILASEFPSLADRVAGEWNRKAKEWADSENAMSIRNREIALTAQVNAQAANERAVIADARATDANESAIAAALSAAQSEASNQSAAAIAAAIGDDAGLPSLAGNGKKALRVRGDELGVEWGSAGAELGDTLSTSRVLDAPEWLPADGSIYLQSSYPELYDLIGPLPFDPAVPSQTISGLSGAGAGFSQGGDKFAVSRQVSPFVDTFSFSAGTYSKLPEVTGGLPPEAATAVALSHDGTYLAVGHSAFPYLSLYKFNGSVFDKLSQPAFPPGAAVTAAAFSPDGQHLFVGTSSASFFEVYKIAGDVFTKISGPASLPLQDPSEIKVSPDGAYVALRTATSQVFIYSRSGDSLSKIQETGYSGLSSIAFSPTNLLAIVADPNARGSRVRILEHDGSEFTEVDQPVFYGIFASCVDFSPTHSLLVVSASGTASRPGGAQLFEYSGSAFKHRPGIDLVSYGVNTFDFCEFSPDGKRLLRIHGSNSIQIFNDYDYDTDTLFRTPRIPALAAGLRNYIKAKP